MDTAHGLDQGYRDASVDSHDAGVGEPTPQIGTDERRMHVRAYNHWVSLLKGRGYPSIEDLDPSRIADFGDHSVLLDFTGGIEDPAIRFIGRALAEEGSLDRNITSISQVPARSLLSRLTDHYLQIIANRAPIGFEAEFVGTRGHTTMYRGILMPFSSDGGSIDFIYGVINWKEMIGAVDQATLHAELAASVRSTPRAANDASVWADGPSAGREPGEPANTTLADQLALARESAAAARAADTRSRAALYRALGRAFDLALAVEDDAAGFEELLEDAGIRLQARAPHVALLKLVFGADYDKTRLTEYGAVIGAAVASDVPAGDLVTFLDGTPGGIKAIVAAERARRRPARPVSAPRSLSDRHALASVAIPVAVEAGATVVLVARASASGMLEVIGATTDAKLAERAVRLI